jgi:prepilin-type N-terminal cleavage/methylation domain-containing protein
MRRAFTLIELLTVIAVIGVLAGILVPVVGRARLSAQTAASTSNLRQLAVATHAYISENRGLVPPATSIDNNTRWHGARGSTSQPFEPSKGWLGPYLGQDGRVKLCPVFATFEPSPESFEFGAGGYGYNMAYLGGPAGDGTPAFPFRPARLAALPAPGRTVMFTATAFARSEGLQEYAFSEPRQGLNPGGQPSWPLQPSTHFRFNGKALVAWVDGRVSAELPNSATGPNYYGGDNAKGQVGWFGPTDANGYWNPWYPENRIP